MIDSGATSNFMDINYALQNKLEIVRLDTPIPLTVVDGSSLSSGSITHHTNLTALIFATSHQESLTFHLLSITSYDIILGAPWLQQHNPSIDWTLRQLSFKSEYCKQHCLPLRAASPATLKETAETVPLDISLVDVTTFESDDSQTPVGILRLCNSTSTTSEVKLPEEYQDFGSLFASSSMDTLPGHQQWDHKIPLVNGKQPPYGPIYALSAVELEALQIYLDENLNRGFITPSSSPAGAPILFRKKKDGSLRLCVDYRGLNAITIKNRYALPLISELLDRLHTAKRFTKLDMRGAYNLVRIA